MRFRQVHLDFHTSEHISGVGSGFDKKQFQEALRTGNVDSITLFAKCHHGWMYYPSDVAEMHPHLKFDLLGAQIEAAHEIGVKTPVYISAGLDEKMARLHPEWLFRYPDESMSWARDFTEPGYHILCMNTPYLDYLIKQIEEVCRLYDADGIFLDIMDVRDCHCRSCCNDMLNRGLDPYNRENSIELAERVYKNYAGRVRAAIDKYKPGLPVFHNSGHIYQGRRDLAGYNSHLELESLPTGEYGYDHFPISAMYASGVGMEYLGMTGKFHGHWGEFGGFKHPNALRYEVALNAALGAKSSIGDQLAPDGHMDLETYKLIGAAYKELEPKEPWLDKVKPVADIGVLSYEHVLSIDEHRFERSNSPDTGAVRILLEGKFLFNFIDAEADFEKYKVIVLPDMVRITPQTENKLKRFIKNGGKLLATGKSGLYADANKFAFDFGVRYIGEAQYNPDYFRPVTEIDGLGNTGYVFYSRGQWTELTDGKELAVRENPYFNRSAAHFCSHQHTPDSGTYGGPGMTEGKDGIYISWEIFTDYALKGNLAYKQIVHFALNKLLGTEKTLTTNLPAQGVATVMRQGERMIIHFLYASPVKRGEATEVIEDIIPVYDITASVKCSKTPKRVYLAPSGEDIDYSFTGGEVKFKLKKLENHQMVVIE